MPLREHLLELRKRVVPRRPDCSSARSSAGSLYPWSSRRSRSRSSTSRRTRGLSSRSTSRASRGVRHADQGLALRRRLVVEPVVGVPAVGVRHPGLTRRERLVRVGFLGAAVPLFLAGAVLAWWLLPQAVGVLTGFTPTTRSTSSTRRRTSASSCGWSWRSGSRFLLPVVMVALNLAGLVERADLAARLAVGGAGRVRLRGGRHPDRRRHDDVRPRHPDLRSCTSSPSGSARCATGAASAASRPRTPLYDRPGRAA